MSFTAERASREHSFTLAMTPERAMEWFTPEGERLWADDWDPVYLFPREGKAQQGMVFTTEAGGEATLWILACYEPTEGRAQYIRVTPGSRVAVVEVECRSEEGVRTRVIVRYTITGLSERGNEYVREMSAQRFADYIDTWPASIAEAMAGDPRPSPEA